MEITKALIEKFLSDHCTDDEAEAVYKYFNEHSELMEAYLSESEWDEVRTSNPSMPKKISREIKRDLDAEIHAPKKKTPKNHTIFSIHSRWKWKFMAASMFILVVSILFIYEKCIKKSINNSAQPYSANDTVQVLADDTCIKNKTENKLDITLPDGSSLLLSQNSSIRFLKSFVPRHVKLRGECYFNVTRDVNNPFSVYTGATVTTALGTSFTISELESKGSIRFDLFTGKVMVKFQAANQDGGKSVFLSPGESMRYNIKRNSASLIKGTEKAKAAKKNPVTRMNYIKENDDQIDFDHVPLPIALDKLKECYHINLIFERQQLNSMHFTGTLFKSLPVEKAIKNIAVVNGLVVQPISDGFIIRKIQYK